jgi:21S rRNA (GM2251-2'-O)-methyltransferase
MALRVAIRQFSSYKKQSTYVTVRAQKQWDHIYGLSSVLAALHSQKRNQLEQLYLQDTTGQKQTTQKKDASLLQQVLELAKKHDISTVFTDKGRLNNLTDNKPHQV